MKLYVVRHGETEWNKQNRLQGHLDSDLTKKGRSDAKLLANRLAKISFTKIISSPSERAMQTAGILRKEHPSLLLETDTRLKEIHLGDWQGKRTVEIIRAHETNYRAYTERPELYQAAKNGVMAESFQEVQGRIEAFLHNLRKSFNGGNVLLVTHGVFIKVLLMRCKGLSVADIWQPPAIAGTSVSIVQLEGDKIEVLLEGDTSHMDS